MCQFQGKQARWGWGGGGWRVECCHGNKGFQWWVSMVIVAKFWEVLNALFKIQNNSAAAADVLRGREEWVVCTFMDTLGMGRQKETRQFKDRHALCVMLFSGYRGLLSLSYRILSHLWVPFVPQSPPQQGNTWDKLRQKSAPTLLLPWTPCSHHCLGIETRRALSRTESSQGANLIGSLK